MVKCSFFLEKKKIWTYSNNAHALKLSVLLILYAQEGGHGFSMARKRRLPPHLCTQDLGHDRNGQYVWTLCF